MIHEVALLNTAIDLLHGPSQVRRFRQSPLPDGVLTVLRIAAGDEEATSQAALATGRSRDTVCSAAAFFIEQILLYPEADSYRVLGAKPEASNSELRHNMALLLRWLHPDRDPQGHRSVLASRVTRAWNDLKSRERRASYDRSMRLALVERSMLRKKGAAYSKAGNHTSTRRPLTRSRYARTRSSFILHPKRPGFLHRVLLLLFWKVIN